MTIRISLAVEIEYEVDDLVELQAQAVTLGGRPGLNSGDAAMLFLDRAPLTERLTLPGTRATITSLRQERTSAYDPDEG